MEIRLNRAVVHSLASIALLTAGLLDRVRADQQKLNGAQITSALEGRTVTGVQNGLAWEQDFQKGGITIYRAAGEDPSEGRWRIKSDQFCSQWPPSRAWICYDIVREDGTVSFVPIDGGDIWRGSVRTD